MKVKICRRNELHSQMDVLAGGVAAWQRLAGFASARPGAALFLLQLRLRRMSSAGAQSGNRPLFGEVDAARFAAITTRDTQTPSLGEKFDSDLFKVVDARALEVTIQARANRRVTIRYVVDA